MLAIEHPGGEGVAVELFEFGLDRFVVCDPKLGNILITDSDGVQQTIQDT
jgi:hypothetical protein